MDNLEKVYQEIMRRRHEQEAKQDRPDAQKVISLIGNSLSGLGRTIAGGQGGDYMRRLNEEDRRIQADKNQQEMARIERPLQDEMTLQKIRQSDVSNKRAAEEHDPNSALSISYATQLQKMGIPVEPGKTSYRQLKDMEDVQLKGLDVESKKLDREQKQSNFNQIVGLKKQALDQQSSRKADQDSKYNKSVGMSLGKEFRSHPVVKDTNTINSSLSKIEKVYAGKPSPAGDMSLVFSYMKLLDPASTVREGEYANAKNATSVPEQVRNAYNKAMQGLLLGEAQRADFVSQARNMGQAQLGEYKKIENMYRSAAKQYGVDDNLVVAPIGPDEVPQIDPSGIQEKDIDNMSLEELRAAGLAD